MSTLIQRDNDRSGVCYVDHLDQKYYFVCLHRILFVLFYGLDAWTLFSTNAGVLIVIERTVLRMTLGPVRVGDDFLMRFNSYPYELLIDMDIVHRINPQRLHWNFAFCSNGREWFGEMDIYRGDLRKSTKKATLSALEGPNRGRPAFARCKVAWWNV